MKILEFDLWANEFTALMIEGVFKLAESKVKDMPIMARHSLYNLFLMKFISRFMKLVMSERPRDVTNKQVETEFVIKNVGESKALLQDAIATGFQDAMVTFSGHPMEYYCTIKVVPVVPNKVREC
jgi:hypothetical protein